MLFAQQHQVNVMTLTEVAWHCLDLQSYWQVHTELNSVAFRYWAVMSFLRGKSKALQFYHSMRQFI